MTEHSAHRRTRRNLKTATTMNNPTDPEPDGFDRANGAPVWCARCHDRDRCWRPNMITTTPPEMFILGCLAAGIDPDWNGECFWQTQPGWVTSEPVTG